MACGMGWPRIRRPLTPTPTPTQPRSPSLTLSRTRGYRTPKLNQTSTQPSMLKPTHTPCAYPYAYACACPYACAYPYP